MGKIIFMYEGKPIAIKRSEELDITIKDDAPAITLIKGSNSGSITFDMTLPKTPHRILYDRQRETGIPHRVSIPAPLPWE